MMTNFKILKSRRALKKTIERCKKWCNVGTTNGCFDLLHYGHIHSLEQIQKQGCTVVVLVNSDKSVKKLKGNSRPIQPLNIRMKQLAALDCVSFVCSFDEITPNNILKYLKPDYHFKSNQYKKEQLAEYETCKKNNIDIKMVKMYPNISTTKLIKKIQNEKKTSKNV